MWKKILPLMVVPLLFAGCATTFTNLSPTRQPRNANNLYPVEVSFDTHNGQLRWDSIKPYVLVGDDAIPLQKVQRMKDRWEGLLPVPANVDLISYRYKFDCLFNDFGPPRQEAIISKKFELVIIDNAQQ